MDLLNCTASSVVVRLSPAFIVKFNLALRSTTSALIMSKATLQSLDNYETIYTKACWILFKPSTRSPIRGIKFVELFLHSKLLAIVALSSRALTIIINS